jgi:hypothetical protein
MVERGSSGSKGKVPDPEVVARPKRRRFTAEYKLRIMREADACREPGEMGALLRREGRRRRGEDPRESARGEKLRRWDAGSRFGTDSRL